MLWIALSEEDTDNADSPKSESVAARDAGRAEVPGNIRGLR
jgi:hypothetical protein